MNEMIKHVNIPQPVIDILDLLHTKTEHAYLVGGCVRDMILGVEPHDYDICSDLSPEAASETLGTKYQVLPKGIKFGTISVLIDGIEYEITTFRGDSKYSDGRHPDSIRFVSNIEEDLERRDFTINAMAFDIKTNTLIDPFDGKSYILLGLLRTVGNPDERFQEDGLRILRALRFAIKYDLQIEPKTKEAMLRNRNMLQSVSRERITEEFRKILTCGKPISQIFMEFSPIIAEVVPEITPCIGLDQENPYHKHDVYEHMLAVTDLCETDLFVIKMAALLHDIGKPKTKAFNEAKDHYSFHGHPEVSYEISIQVLSREFRCTSIENDRIVNLIRYHDTEIIPTKPCVKRWLNKFGVDFMRDWLILKTADRDDHVYPNEYGVVGENYPTWYPKTEEIEVVLNEILQEQSAFAIKDLAINGHDLIAIGLKPGPKFSRYLQKCLEAVMDGTCENNHDELLKFVVQLLMQETRNVIVNISQLLLN